MKLNNLRIAFRLSLVAVALLLVCGMAAAQNDQVKGVINGRSGATLSVLSQGGESITVVLTPDTQVLEPCLGALKTHLPGSSWRSTKCGRLRSRLEASRLH
jgi:hypothetical protein